MKNALTETCDVLGRHGGILVKQGDIIQGVIIAGGIVVIAGGIVVIAGGVVVIAGAVVVTCVVVVVGVRVVQDGKACVSMHNLAIAVVMHLATSESTVSSIRISTKYNNQFCDLFFVCVKQKQPFKNTLRRIPGPLH